jgi:hypothetical protein
MRRSLARLLAWVFPYPFLGREPHVSAGFALLLARVNRRIRTRKKLRARCVKACRERG